MPMPLLMPLPCSFFTTSKDRYTGPTGLEKQKSQRQGQDQTTCG